MGRTKRDWNSIHAGSNPRPFDLGWLKNVLTQRGKALDIGCGTGGNTAGLTRLGWDATGLDSSETAIATARREAGKYRVEDITQIAEKPIYNLVIINYALPERGTLRQQVLAAARAALAPSGTLAITEWDSRYAWWGSEDDYATATEMAAAMSTLEAASISSAQIPAYLSPAHQNGLPGPRVALRAIGYNKPLHRNSPPTRK